MLYIGTLLLFSEQKRWQNENMPFVIKIKIKNFLIAMLSYTTYYKAFRII